MLKLNAAMPYEPISQDNREIWNHVGRRSGLKHVYGNIYKHQTWGHAITHFFAASRGNAVMAKAHFESKHFVQAAILRKNAVAEQTAAGLNRPLNGQEYEDLVWNSNGVLNRLTREDQIRYGDPEHFKKEEGTSKRNRVARYISRIGHGFHGACELNSAPTGMTQQSVRPFLLGQTDEKSLKNKIFMASSLGFIGTAFSTMLRTSRSESVDSAKKSGAVSADALGKGLMSALIAFPAISACMGVLGTFAGICSQAVVEKQAPSYSQKERLTDSLTNDLQKLLHFLKSVKGNQQQIKIVGKAMQGRHHIINKFQNTSRDADGVPKILNAAIRAIDPAKTETDNLNALKDVLGKHMQVDKPPRETSNFWQRYMYGKRVTGSESEYVALMSVVDHKDLDNPHAKLQKDYRKKFEDKVPLALHNLVLKGLAYPASVIDELLDTNVAGTLRKWASPEYKKRQAEKLADPLRAAKNRYNGEYMAKHIHQYHSLTKSLIKLSEGLRLIAMNVVLAQNANLSRCFANTAAGIQQTLGTGPASRSICQSIGRALGGSALAAILGVALPAAASGHSYSFEMDVGQKTDASASASNAGIIMFLLSVPSMALMLLAMQTAKMEGWKGNICKQVPKGSKTFTL